MHLSQHCRIIYKLMQVYLEFRLVYIKKMNLIELNILHLQVDLSIVPKEIGLQIGEKLLQLYLDFKNINHYYGDIIILQQYFAII
jgi:hypothetical protein